MKALCCILNYSKDKTQNINYLYKEFNKYCKVNIINYNDYNTYQYCKNIGNFYYINMFNESIKKFKEGHYSNLILINSNVKIGEDAIEYVSNLANTEMSFVGVLSLQADKDSKVEFNQYENNLPRIRAVKNIDGFFQIINRDVVLLLKEISLSKNDMCIYKYICEISRKIKKYNIIDSTFLINNHYQYYQNNKFYDNINIKNVYHKLKKCITK